MLTRPRPLAAVARGTLILGFTLAVAGQAGATGATFSDGFSSLGGGRTAVTVGDFDGDGDRDIATGTAGLGAGVFWYENGGAYPASFTVSTLLSGIGSQTTALDAADLTGFGIADEFVSATGGVVRIWEYSAVSGSLVDRSLGSALALGLDAYPPQDRVYLALGTDLGYGPVSGAPSPLRRSDINRKRTAPTARNRLIGWAFRQQIIGR